MAVRNVDLKIPFTGLYIPADIWLDDNLTISERVLYSEIVTVTDGGRQCPKDVPYFAAFLGISEDEVKKLATSLAQKGYVCFGKE